MKRILLLFLVAFTVNAQGKTIHTTNISNRVYAIHEDRYLRIPPPAAFLMKSANENTCEIEVRYHGFSDEAEAAFEYAVQIWETLLVSSEVIYMDAYWQEIESDDGHEILGAAGASNYFIDKDGFPISTVFFPAPLAEKLAQTNLNAGTNSDMFAYFNSESDWYLGTDGNTPQGLFDFVTVVLHELCHGLGFIGSLDIDEGVGQWGYGSYNPFSYDRFVYNANGEQLINWEMFPNPSSELYEQLTGNNLYFDGPALRYHHKNKVPLYVPAIFDAGSSIDHLSNSFNNTANGLMTPGIARASSIHDPGRVVLSIMEDIGWSTIHIEHKAVSNTEEVKDLFITADILPDFETELVDPVVVYSVNGSNETMIKLVSTGGSTYTATIPIVENAKVDYHLAVTDKYNRTFNYPNTAPKEGMSVVIAVDSVPPAIVHYANEHFYIEEDELVLLANVTDDFGIDTVVVEYFINESSKAPMGMKYLKNDAYNLVIDLSDIELDLNDTLFYRIRATDNANARNSITVPESGFYQLVVSNLPTHIATAEYNFDSGSNEFVLDGFDFSIAKGFSNTALNSEHPYENGGQNTSLNFTAQLKVPILIDDVDHYIEFDEIALIENGEENAAFGTDDFYDYVVVEGSIDEGETWIPFEEGWDCTLHAEWELAYNQSLKFNNIDILEEQDLYRSHKINLTAPEEFNPGDLVLLRFRLFSDPFAVGWGWSIDNLKIQSLGLRNSMVAQNRLTIYPNPVRDGLITINGAEEAIESAVIIDRLGNKVVEYNQLENNSTLTLPANIKKGLYLIILHDDSGYVTSRFLVD